MHLCNQYQNQDVEDFQHSPNFSHAPMQSISSHFQSQKPLIFPTVFPSVIQMKSSPEELNMGNLSLIPLIRPRVSFFFEFYLFIFYTAGSYQLSILYMLVYICQSQSPNSSHHHHPTPLSRLGVQTPCLSQWDLVSCLEVFLESETQNFFICI